jgi:hypothetical protein
MSKVIGINTRYEKLPELYYVGPVITLKRMVKMEASVMLWQEDELRMNEMRTEGLKHCAKTPFCDYRGVFGWAGAFAKHLSVRANNSQLWMKKAQKDF